VYDDETTVTDTARAPRPRSADDAALAPAPGGADYSSSNVTRLLCAGVYLDDGYRRSVIRELLTERFRQIAPSYGYDVVPVLGHALAAHTVRVYHAVFLLMGLVLFGLLWMINVLSFVPALLLFAWAAWVGSFLLRIVTLETLIREFKPGRPESGAGFQAVYPRSDRLGPDRAAELTEQQATDHGVIYYGGFTPFVGAGYELGSWANAELLIEAAPSPLFGSEAEREEDPFEGGGADGADGRADGLIPFDVREITDYVAEHLAADLHERAEESVRIEGLVVERRRYAKAIAKRASGRIDAQLDVTQIHWKESYDAAREYLCIRIGSWDQEVVTSMFVGFDIKGNTLHTEFYPYVLPPIKEAFHAVDRLPDELNPRLLGRLALHSLFAMPLETLGTLLSPLALRLPNSTKVVHRLDRKLAKGHRGSVIGDLSSLGLARYAGVQLDRGARFSVRQLATVNELHHFFQKSDMVKYLQVVERSLLHVIETFLCEHNVDLTDHRAAQASILNQSFGDVHNHGDGNITSLGNRGRQGIRATVTRPRSAKEGSK
jgi:hypothetical protein